MIRKISFSFLLSFSFYLLSSQPGVRIRLFAETSPHYLFFKVSSGQYIIDSYSGKPLTVMKGEVFIISLFKNRLAVKLANDDGFEADSLFIRGSGKNDSFSLRTNSRLPAYHNYSGSLECIPDLGSLLVINTVDIENYVAGVVRAEAGNGKNEEYFKTQAVITRTYTYKYLKKHIADRYNLCDDTHCQAFNGITGDSLINAAVKQTAGQVLITPDSNLIISAFHSNCGGETAPSEYVWLVGHPYLTKVVDPFCITSKNATWQKSVSLKEWGEMLARNGFKEPVGNTESFVFSQQTRIEDYTTGSFKLPFSKIRNELGLRSSWFSISASGDSLLLKGKGYGHGVGLCQEGAMAMAYSGKKYEQILKFYYHGVSLAGIEAAKMDEDEN